MLKRLLLMVWLVTSLMTYDGVFWMSISLKINLSVLTAYEVLMIRLCLLPAFLLPFYWAPPTSDILIFRCKSLPLPQRLCTYSFLSLNALQPYFLSHGWPFHHLGVSSNFNFFENSFSNYTCAVHSYHIMVLYLAWSTI